jgi:hypothetical protein
MKEINKQDIVNYYNAVNEFNSMIKKQTNNKKTLCENFVSDWADVITYINKQNKDQ